MKVYGIILLIIFYAVHTNAQAQPHFPNKKYPAKSFRNPLSTPFSLVGNFGECRPNHFHSGIDIRTDGKENKKFMPLKMDIFPELQLRKVDLAMPFILTMPVAIHPCMPI
ncbi:MAG: hypothetical protein IPI22_10170 [Bacteroidetes bacterium]|nr:hypothetical protein [Bacteroidota bacterium]